MNTDESCGIQENFKGGVAMAESHHSHARQKSPEERLLDTRFDAYISYRGCDEADAKLGAALQKQLEHYVLPLERTVCRIKTIWNSSFRTS